MNAKRCSRGRELQIIFLLTFAVGGCCGTKLWSPRLLPKEISFQAALPPDVHVPSDSEQVILPLIITNNSTGNLCFGRYLDGEWCCGLLVEYSIDEGNAPIKSKSAQLSVQGLTGRLLGHNRAVSEYDHLRLRILPIDKNAEEMDAQKGFEDKNDGRVYVTRDIEPLRLVFQPDPTAAAGAEGQLLVSIGLRVPGVTPGQETSVVQLPVRITISNDDDVLFSAPYSRSSKKMEMPHAD